MKFSVLICTYNRHDLLEQCLGALICRTIEKPDEVVIVNGGDERADEVVKHAARIANCELRIADLKPIRSQRSEVRIEKQEAKSEGRTIEINLIKTVNKNLAASRNIGLPHCTGDIIAMTDDDAEVFPDWVTEIKRLHAEHSEAGAIGGAVIGADSDRNFLSRLSDILTFVSPSESCYVRTVPGVNASYKRKVIEKVGEQDETLFRGEDVDYNWRVKKLGYQILYHPQIKVIHHHRLSLSQFLRQHYMYGRAYYLVRRKWPEMYCVYPHDLRNVKNVLKLGYFLFGILIQPLQFTLRLSTWKDRVKAIPILAFNQIAWKGGMLYQKWLTG
jgi:GT2 family glycosyltransferase